MLKGLDGFLKLLLLKETDIGPNFGGAVGKIFPASIQIVRTPNPPVTMY